MNNIVDSLLTPTILLGLFFGGFVLLFFYVLKVFKNEQKDETLKAKNEKVPINVEKKKDSSISKSKKKNSENRWSNRNDKQTFSHPWLLTSFKGHTGQVLDMDFSSNGKYLATCGDDRTVFLWDSKDLGKKEHRSVRVNIDFDYPTFVKWSPDSRAFIIQKFNENSLEVYKVEKKKDGSISGATKALTFPKVHETDVIGMGIASTGKFIMSCSNKTDLVIWDLKGQQLAQIDTYLMSTTCAKISPCGRFVVASGFAPDAKVWEVLFTKSGEFQEVKRVFELSGHSSGIYNVAFDVDSSHMATVSKDGTWKLFDTKIDYKKGQAPYLKITGKYEQSGNNALIALSPNAEVVVIAVSNSIYLYSAQTAILDHCIKHVYASENITSVNFDASGDYLMVTGDRQVRVFHNVTGYKCKIESAKYKLKEHQTSATKERLEKLIIDSENFIQSIKV